MVSYYLGLLCCIIQVFVACAASDCQVSQWQNWLECVGNCNFAMRVRNRDVAKPPFPEMNAHGKLAIEPCPPLYQVQQCVLDSCTSHSQVYNGTDPKTGKESAQNGPTIDGLSEEPEFEADMLSNITGAGHGVEDFAVDRQDKVRAQQEIVVPLDGSVKSPINATVIESSSAATQIPLVSLASTVLVATVPVPQPVLLNPQVEQSAADDKLDISAKLPQPQNFLIFAGLNASAVAFNFSQVTMPVPLPFPTRPTPSSVESQSTEVTAKHDAGSNSTQEAETSESSVVQEHETGATPITSTENAKPALITSPNVQAVKTRIVPVATPATSTSQTVTSTTTVKPTVPTAPTVSSTTFIVPPPAPASFGARPSEAAPVGLRSRPSEASLGALGSRPSEVAHVAFGSFPSESSPIGFGSRPSEPTLPGSVISFGSPADKSPQAVQKAPAQEPSAPKTIQIAEVGIKVSTLNPLPLSTQQSKLDLGNQPPLFSVSHGPCDKADGNKRCCKQTHRNKCPDGKPAQMVLRWFRIANQTECGAYNYGYCGYEVETQDNPIKFEQECYDLCYTEDDRRQMSVFRDLRFHNGFRLLGVGDSTVQPSPKTFILKP